MSRPGEMTLPLESSIQVKCSNENVSELSAIFSAPFPYGWKLQVRLRYFAAISAGLAGQLGSTIIPELLFLLQLNEYLLQLSCK